MDVIVQTLDYRHSRSYLLLFVILRVGISSSFKILWFKTGYGMARAPFSVAMVYANIAKHDYATRCAKGDNMYSIV